MNTHRLPPLVCLRTGLCGEQRSGMGSVWTRFKDCTTKFEGLKINLESIQEKKKYRDCLTGTQSKTGDCWKMKLPFKFLKTSKKSTSGGKTGLLMWWTFRGGCIRGNRSAVVGKNKRSDHVIHVDIENERTPTRVLIRLIQKSTGRSGM